MQVKERAGREANKKLKSRLKALYMFCKETNNSDGLNYKRIPASFPLTGSRKRIT